MTDLPPFYSAGLDTLSAIKLFVLVGSLPGTSFRSEMKRVDDDLCPVIQYNGYQASGTITRTLDELIITVMPNPQTAKDFVPRTMIFREVDFDSSEIMIAVDAEILSNGGRDYAMTIAETIAAAHPTSTHLPSPCGGEHTIVLGPPRDKNVLNMLSRIAQQIDADFQGHFHCLIAHPSLDQKANCFLIDNEDQPIEPSSPHRELLADMRKAAQLLPTALRITQYGAAYPLPFRIYPHRFTIEPETDATMRTTRGMLARAALSDLQTNRKEFHFCVVPVQPTGEFEKEELSRLAGNQLLTDWKARMGDEAPPAISDAFSIEEDLIDERLAVRLTVVVSPKAAERYSMAGLYEILPE